MEALINLRRCHRSSSASYLPKLIEWQVNIFRQVEHCPRSTPVLALEGCQLIFSRVDLADATSNLTKPRFLSHQPPTKNSTASDEEEFEASLDAQWGPDFPPDQVKMLEGMDNRTAKLFHRVRQLSTIANRMAVSNLDPEFQTQYTQGIQLLERQVNAAVWSLNLNNIRQHGSATRPKESIVVRTCTRTWHCATLTFIYMVLRQTPTSSQIVEKLARRLKFSLRILTPEELWDHFPPRFLLWVLVVANIASTGHADRLWLLQTLKQLREKIALENWEAAKVILVELAWVEHVCTRPAILIWKELDNAEL